MTRVWLYTVGSSSDPDHVKSVVPWEVDDDQIFFGPCKKRMREQLRKQYLRADRSHATASGDLFIVGANASNSQHVRKVVWAGKLREVMTFAEAFNRLKGERYAALRDHEKSPLHVRPVVKGGKLIGYAHRSQEHIDENHWITDLTADEGGVRLEGRTITVRYGTAWARFDRDCCMLLDNRFFAQGQGIDFDQTALAILRAAQPRKTGIDDFAIFGLASNAQPDGLRGRYLQIDGELADQFVAWLEARAEAIGQEGDDGEEPSTKKPCSRPKKPTQRRTIAAPC